MSAAEVIRVALLAWVAVGALVAVPFLAVGVGRVDAAARGSVAFRLVVLPGCVALWPVVLRWWARGGAA